VRLHVPRQLARLRARVRTERAAVRSLAGVRATVNRQVAAVAKHLPAELARARSTENRRRRRQTVAATAAAERTLAIVRRTRVASRKHSDADGVLDHPERRRQSRVVVDAAFARDDNDPPRPADRRCLLAAVAESVDDPDCSCRAQRGPVGTHRRTGPRRRVRRTGPRRRRWTGTCRRTAADRCRRRPRVGRGRGADASPVATFGRPGRRRAGVVGAAAAAAATRRGTTSTAR